MNDFIYVHPGDTVIPAEQLQHRMLYRLAARGLHYGVWDANKQGFLGLKPPYLEYEYEWFGNGNTGTAHAVETITPLPDEIELWTTLSGRCVLHERPTMSRRRKVDEPWWDWFHADDGSPLTEDDHSYLPPYMPMHEFLAGYEHE